MVVLGGPGDVIKNENRYEDQREQSKERKENKVKKESTTH